MVVWILLTLSLAAASVGFTVRQHIRLVEHLNIRQSLRDIAEAGVKKAMRVVHAKAREEPFYDASGHIWRNDEAAFKSQPLGRGSFSVFYETNGTRVYGIEDEESKINLNKIRDAVIWAGLLEYGVGLKKEDARAVSVSMLDWMDKDEDMHDVGAESDFYATLSPPYKAKNAPLEMLDELMWIKGVTPVIFSRLKPYVTLQSNGSININTASPVVLRALGFSDSLLAKVMAFRRGIDGIPGTEDDLAFKELGSAVDALNQFQFLGAEERQNFTDFLQSGTFNVASEYFKIYAVAELTHRPERLAIECTVKRYGQPARWQEQFESAEQK